jgi:arsenate reductase-like glutaredoxin family protein
MIEELKYIIAVFNNNNIEIEIYQNKDIAIEELSDWVKQFGNCKYVFGTIHNDKVIITDTKGFNKNFNQLKIF